MLFIPRVGIERFVKPAAEPRHSYYHDMTAMDVRSARWVIVAHRKRGSWGVVPPSRGVQL